MKNILQRGILIICMLLLYPTLSLAQVHPEDFEGRYGFACGENKGILEIVRQKSIKKITYFGGYYTTDDKKTYPIKGEVNRISPNEITLTIEFPRPKKFIGYLMDKTMDTITGHTVTEKPVGFFAARMTPLPKASSKTDDKKGADMTGIGIIKAIGRASTPGKLSLAWEYGSGEMPVSLEIDVYSEGKSIIAGRSPVTISGSMTQVEINVTQVLYIPHEIVCCMHYPSGVVPADKVYVATCRMGEKAACLPAKQPAPIVKIDIPETAGKEITPLASTMLSWEYGEGEWPVSLTLDIQRDGGTVLPMGELITINGAETQKEISIWRLLDRPHDIIFYARYPYGTIPREKIYTFRQRIKK